MVKKKGYYLKATLLLLALLLFVVGCTSTPEKKALPAAGDERPGELEAVEKREERVLRLDEDNLGFPAFYTVSPRGRGFLLNSFLFDTLTWKDEKGIVPLLAEEWSVSEDNRIWTFKLVENARFTDGRPLTADDVKFTFEYIKQHPHPWVSLDVVERVEVLDNYRVAVHLKDVYAPFLTEIAGNVPILPRHIWEGVSEPQKFNAPEAVIGSGPFTLAKYDETAGTYIFEANPDYFLGPPVVDRLVFSEVPHPAQALKNGDIDVAQRVSYGEAMRMKDEGEFKVLVGPGFWVYRLYFNFDLPEFNKTALRQAFYYAINREEIVEKAMGSGAVPGNPGHIHPESEWYHSKVKDYPFDPEKAKEILSEAGFVDSNRDGIREYQGAPLSYDLLVANDRVKEAEMLRSYLKEIGVAVEIKAVDQKTLDSLIKEGNFALALNGHGSFGGDPVLLARFVSDESSLGHTPSVTGQGGARWKNEEFDRLFAQQLRELDYEKRYALVARMQEIIAEELPTLTLYYRIITVAYNPKKLDGWFFTKDGVARAVPTIQNKLVYIRGTWGE